jgi:hypothetical protein
MPRGDLVRRQPLLPAKAAVLFVGIYLAVALPVGLYNTARRWRAAAAAAGVPPAAMRAIVFGGRYTAAVEAIRGVIREDEPYLLSGRTDALVWVRYDLLPRRAARQEALAASPNDCWFAQIRWSVVARELGRPPLLLARPVIVPPGCPAAPWRQADAASPPPALPAGSRR